MRCHGEPAKLIFSSYPFWPGAFGSMRFPTKTVMETESNAYAEFVKLSVSHPRYKYLVPTGTEQTCLLNDSCDYINYYSPLERQTADLDAVLARAHAERTAAQMIVSPEYSKTKYAIAAALLECKNWPRVLPDATRSALEANVETLFNLKSRITDKVSRDFLRAAYESSDARELPFGEGEAPPFAEAIAGLKEIFGPNPDFLRLQMDTLIKQGPHEDAFMPAGLRLLMEGRGLRINDWFLSFEQEKYHTHDGGAVESDGWLRALLRRDPELVRYLPRVEKLLEAGRATDDSLCEEWAAMSRSALATLRVPALRAASQARPGYPKTFTATCARCHTFGGDSDRAPVIPFNDEVTMAEWLAQPANRKSVLDKISGKAVGVPMPPGRFLAPAEMIEIRNYLKQ